MQGNASAERGGAMRASWLLTTEGTCWVGPTVWRGSPASRGGFCGWSTSAVDLEKSPQAVLDWYLVHDFGALGLLNEAAVSTSRAAPHDAAAAVAAGGAGGLYGLRHGATLRQPQHAHWSGNQRVWHIAHFSLSSRLW